MFFELEQAYENKKIFSLALALNALAVTGCSSLHVSENRIVQTPWESFDEAKSAYDEIVTGRSQRQDLARLGFDPYVNPNVKVLTYLDIQRMFLPNSSVKFEHLPSPVQDCLTGKEDSLAYEINAQMSNSRRHGNLLLDMLSFSRLTREIGWKFNALILICGDKVVYKLWSGQPRLVQFVEKRRPLGPLQELEGRIAIPIGW